jgi:amino acid transporter
MLDKVIAAVAMISTFGALNGWIMLQGRVPLAAAEVKVDGEVNDKEDDLTRYQMLATIFPDATTDPPTLLTEQKSEASS